MFPKYPRVVVDGKEIVIQYENGKKEVWGRESDITLARKIALDIELGLKAIDYVALELIELLSNIVEILEAEGVPSESINEYIWEGYSKVLKRFNEPKPNKILLKF